MWNSYAKMQRVRVALRHHYLKELSGFYHGQDLERVACDRSDTKYRGFKEIIDLAVKKGMTDTILNDFIIKLIGCLEPPSCLMTHCKHYGNQESFCDCSLERIPHNCDIYRAFRKRKREREKKKGK